jgi:hypothetical protein
MLATLKMMREKFVNAETYMVEKCGLSREEVAMIKANMTVNEAPTLHKVPQVL